MRRAITIVTLCLAAGAAFAQTPPPADPSAGAAPSATDSRSARRAKAQACRTQAQSQGKRGDDLRDAVALCVAEGQLACLKSAIDAKTRGAARRSFMRDCMSKG